VPIFAQALTCRHGFDPITQVAITRAQSKEGAEKDGLATILSNFPRSEGYTAHACACKQVSVDMILKEAAQLLQVHFSDSGKDST